MMGKQPDASLSPVSDREFATWTASAQACDGEGSLKRRDVTASPPLGVNVAGCCRRWHRRPWPMVKKRQFEALTVSEAGRVTRGACSAARCAPAHVGDLGRDSSTTPSPATHVRVDAEAASDEDPRGETEGGKDCVPWAFLFPGARQHVPGTESFVPALFSSVLRGAGVRAGFLPSQDPCQKKPFDDASSLGFVRVWPPGFVGWRLATVRGP